MTKAANPFTEALKVRKRPGTQCSIGLVRSKMSPELLAQFDAAMSMDVVDMPHVTVTEGLKIAGFTVPNGAVSHHRRGLCTCGK